MKIIILIILGLVFVWYLIKGLIQAWPFGWPLINNVDAINKDKIITDLDLRVRLTKEAIKSLVICLVIAFIIQFIL